MPLTPGELREGERILRAGRSLADMIEGERNAELRRAEEIRNSAEKRLAVKLAAIWSDDEIWRRVPGGVQVLDTSKKALLRKKRQQSLDVIDREYEREARGLLPRVARA